MKTEIIDSADGNNITHLHLATKSSSKKIMNLLLSRRASIDYNGNNATTSCHIAADTRKPCPPLHLAVGKGNEEITELLLTKGANVDAIGRHGTTSLCIATERGYLEIVKHLLKHGADVNSAYTSTTQHGYIPLHLAVKNASEEIIEWLLSKGANGNAAAKDGVISLRIALRAREFQIAEHLLKHGADVNSAYTSTTGHEKLTSKLPNCF